MPKVTPRILIPITPKTPADEPVLAKAWPAQHIIASPTKPGISSEVHQEMRGFLRRVRAKAAK